MPNSEEITGAFIAGLYRYPVKGMTPERLERIALSAGATMPFDRAYAIENGKSLFDPANPKYLPKAHFVMLMRDEDLASLRASFHDATHTLTVRINGAVAAVGDLRTTDGRAAIERLITETLGPKLRGAPRIVAAPGHSFSDVAAKCLHVIYLESVRALEAKMGMAVNPLRFRPNVILDGLPAWSEFDLVDRRVFAGEVELSGFKRTERCTATNVDPETALRDFKIPSFLSKTYGHTDFGIYARVVAGGDIAVGNAVICDACRKPSRD